MNEIIVRKELTVSIAGRDVKVFMQNDFFGYSDSSTVVHKNACTELHCIESGRVEYSVSGERFFAKAGDLIVIPAGVFHKKDIPEGERPSVCIFQIDFPIESMLKKRLSPDIYTELIRSTEEYKSNGEIIKLSAYLALICSYVIDGAQNEITRAQDRNFLIREFFYTNYYHPNPRLSELAATLGLSEKQTERAVMSCTGRHFREELAYRRIEAAKYIFKNEGITLAEAAERVGYKSYSGFWKAFKLYGGNAE